MSDKLISELSAASTLDGTELVPGDQSGGDVKITTQAIADLGGGSAGSPIVRKFPFGFDTPNLLTGATVYTPTVGDILLDAWIEIDSAWNGTTPFGDFGPFINGNTGLFANGPDLPAPCDMTMADSEPLDTGLLSALGLGGGLDYVQNTVLSYVNAGPSHGQTGSGTRLMPLKFTAANPIKVCVSQDGTNTGADPGSSQGSAVLYLVTVTPV